MALTFFWRCEGTTLDGTHDYSAGDTTATLNSSAEINSTAVRVGTNGLQIPTANDRAEFSPSGLVGTGEGALALSLRLVAFNSNATIAYAFGTDANDHLYLRQVGTDDATGRELRFRLRSTGGGAEIVNLDTTAADLQLDTWYGVVCRWDAAADLMKLEVYNADGSLRTEVSSTASISPLVDVVTLAFGEDGNASGNYYLDNIFLADDYAEPLEDNLTITSYTSYGGGGAPTITDAGDEAYSNGESGIVITGSGFGASQGTGQVIISPSDDPADLGAVAQTVTAWSATSITFTCVKGSLAFNTNLYLFVEADGGLTNSSGHVVQITGTRKLKVLVHSSAASASGVEGEVSAAPTGGQITGAKIGYFSGKTFDGALESGQAVLKVPVADFGGGSLTTTDTPVVLVRNTTYTTGMIPATVIEE